MSRLQLLKDVESAAREFVRHGLRLTPEGLIVRETADKSDPYCKLCDALEAVEPLNPKIEATQMNKLA